MIKKERLGELIEQEEIIWHDDYGEIKLNKDCEVCEVRSMSGEHITWFLCFEYEYNNRKQWGELDIKELEEDVEVGKWKYEMHTSRTEYFEPPMFEEWLDKEIFEFYSKDHKHYAISVCIEFDFFESPAKDYIEITDVNDFEHNKLFCAGKTKENYIKAVEYARKLFKGEEV